MDSVYIFPKIRSRKYLKSSGLRGSATVSLEALRMLSASEETAWPGRLTPAQDTAITYGPSDKDENRGDTPGGLDSIT